MLTRGPIEILGTIKFTDDTDYWQDASFDFVYQNVSTFFKLGGDDVFIYGGESGRCSPTRHPIPPPSPFTTHTHQPVNPLGGQTSGSMGAQGWLRP